MTNRIAPLALALALWASPSHAQQAPQQPPARTMDETAMARLLQGPDGERVRRFAATAAVAAHCGQDPNPHVQAVMGALRARPGLTPEQLTLLSTYGEAVAGQAMAALEKTPCDARMRTELERRKRQDLDSLRR